MLSWFIVVISLKSPQSKQNQPELGGPVLGTGERVGINISYCMFWAIRMTHVGKKMYTGIHRHQMISSYSFIDFYMLLLVFKNMFHY